MKILFCIVFSVCLACFGVASADVPAAFEAAWATQKNTCSPPNAPPRGPDYRGPAAHAEIFTNTFIRPECPVGAVDVRNNAPAQVLKEVAMVDSTEYG